MVDWEQSGKRIPDGAFTNWNLNRLPQVLIQNIPQADFIAQSNDWVGLLPTRYIDWRPSSTNSGEVVAVEMPSAYHEAAVRAVEAIINSAQEAAGIFNQHRLHHGGSMRMPSAAEPDGCWVPQYTKEEKLALFQQGCEVVLTLISEIGVSQNLTSIETKIQRYCSNPLPKLFLVVRIIPFIDGVEFPVMDPLPRMPDLFCQVRMYQRDEQDDVAFRQEYSLGNVDEQGRILAGTSREPKIQLPVDLLFFGGHIPSQLVNSQFLDLNFGTLIAEVRSVLEDRYPAIIANGSGRLN